jgi:hypothetical protein
MHAIHPDRRVLLGALVAFLCALVAAAAAPSLPDVDLGGASAPAPEPVTQHQTGAPTWVTDPLAPPALLRDAR